MRSLMEGVEALWWLRYLCVCERGADLAANIPNPAREGLDM
jgi:hypothetical protein